MPAPDTPEEPDAPARRPSLTMSEAARATGKAKVTIRRALDDDKFPNAWRGPSPGGAAPGAWMIPIDDLLAAGFTLHAPAPTEAEAQEAESTPPPQLHVGIPVEEHEALRRRAEDAERRASRAELEAELLNANLVDLRVALRVLEAGTTPPLPLDQPETPPDPVSAFTWSQDPASTEPIIEPGTGLPVAGSPPRLGWWARRRAERHRREVEYLYATSPSAEQRGDPGAGT